MALQTLIDKTKEEGIILLNELRKNNFPFDTAFWNYTEDNNKWKLIIESPVVNEKGPQAAYGMLITSIRDLRRRKPQFSIDSVDIHLVRRGDRIARRLHDAAKDGLVRPNEHFTGATKWGYVEDSYVYFIGEPATL